MNEHENPLKIRQEIGAQGVSKRCPNCGMDMDAESTFCPQCGYDEKTGKTVTQKKAAQKKLMLLLLLLILVGGAAALLVLKPVPEDPPSEPSETTQAATEKTAPKAPSRAPQAAPSPPAPPTLDELRALLDKNIPFVKPGGRAELRDSKGRVHKGMVISLRNGQVILKNEQKKVQVFNLGDLDQNSRLAIDADFREAVLLQRFEEASM